MIFKSVEQLGVTLVVPKSTIDRLKPGAYCVDTMDQIEWRELRSNEPRRFVCQHCASIVGSNKGWAANLAGGHCKYVYLCQNCFSPTYFDEDGNQFPGPTFGEKLSDLPPAIESLHEEARQCMSVNAYTAASMCCRKLLMNVSVARGAEEGNTYAFYVQYLADNHYVPPDATGWVDQIRDIGNEANHEIRIVKKENAEDALRFTEMLLRLVFVYPALAAKRSGESP